MWTAFEETSGIDEAACAVNCRNNLNCLTHFLGHGGCYYAMQNHSHQESQARRSFGIVGAD